MTWERPKEGDWFKPLVVGLLITMTFSLLFGLALLIKAFNVLMR